MNVMNVLTPFAIVDRYSNFIIIYEDDVGWEEDSEDHPTPFTSHLTLWGALSGRIIRRGLIKILLHPPEPLGEN